MIEYKQILKDLGNHDSWEVFHLSVTNRGQGNKKLAKQYLKKYWLTDATYKNEWAAVHHSLFDVNKQLPDMIFKQNFDFISLLGGVMFEAEDFERFRSCIKKLGEKDFVIIEQATGTKRRSSPATFRMRYPIDIAWDELMNGDFVSVSLFEKDENDYYIFGKSNLWGMYVANNFFESSSEAPGNPIRIIGFHPLCRDIFRVVFKIPEGEYCENLNYIPEKERPDLNEWTPRRYKEKNNTTQSEV